MSNGYTCLQFIEIYVINFDLREFYNKLTICRHVPRMDKLAFVILGINMVVCVFAIVYFGVKFIVDVIQNRQMNGRIKDKNIKWLEKALPLKTMMTTIGAHCSIL